MDDIIEQLEHLATHLDHTGQWQHIETISNTIHEINRLRTENAAIRRQALKNMIEISENAGMYNHD